MTTNLSRIIRCYLANGGSTMSEEVYQRYKLAILNNWLDKYFVSSMFEIEIYWQCRECNNAEAIALINAEDSSDKCLAHLKQHHPEFFIQEVGANKKTKTKKAKG